MKSRNSFKLILVIFIFVFINQNINSQQSYYLTLDSAISTAKEKSHRMRMLKENLNQATYRLKSIKQSFLPRLDFSGNLPAYSEIFIEDYNKDSLERFFQKTRKYSGSLSFSQVLPSDGRLSINYNAANWDVYRTYSTRLFESGTSINFEQPLKALYAYNEMLARYKEIKLNFELANKQYKRAELDLIYNISSLFYATVAAEKQKEIAFQNLKRQEEAFKLAKNKYETGLIREVEALQIEVDYGEAVNNYDIQVTSYIQNSQQLKQELGLSLTDSILTKNSLDYNVVQIDPAKAVEMGLRYRTEIRERQIQISLNELDVKRQKSEGIISGNIGAYYLLQGNYSTNLNTSIPEAFDRSTNLMLKEPPRYGLTFSVQIPILDWGSNRSLVKMQKARLNQNMLALDYEIISIENEIRSTVDRLHSNLRRLQLLEKNVKLAEKSYDISYLRFTNGDIDVEALGLDRIRFINAQLSYLQAYINYKLLLLDLNRKTFFDFENNTSLVPDNL